METKCFIKRLGNRAGGPSLEAADPLPVGVASAGECDVSVARAPTDSMVGARLSGRVAGIEAEVTFGTWGEQNLVNRSLGQEATNWPK